MKTKKGLNMTRSLRRCIASIIIPIGAIGSNVFAAEGEQDDVSKALDSTATQWSFQFAYQNMPNYKDDYVDGKQRPKGADDFVQFRIVAPLAYENFTILPRLTFRHYENGETGKSGIGNTELFGIVIPKSWDWGSGRMGFGPLITAPGDSGVAKDEWGGGLAGAIVNTSGNWFYGFLLTQTWQAVDPLALPPGSSNTNPLGIAPFLNYQFGGGWYVGNGDMIVRYDWDSKEVYMPIGVRFGKVIVGANSSWNIYGEYQTSLVYDDYPGPAVADSFRINVTYTMPGL
jgi:hypothetical protein